MSSLWAAIGGAAVLTAGVVSFRASPDEWWLLPGTVLSVLFLSILLGFPIALVTGVPISMLLRRFGLTRSRHYIVAGAFVSIIAYALYLSYRWWWQADDPMFPTLRTSLREFGLAAILQFEATAAICILVVGPFSAWCYWKSSMRPNNSLERTREG